MQPTQILKPRNPGEALKVAETVLKHRNHDLQAMAQRAKQRLALRKVKYLLFQHFFSFSFLTHHL